MHTVLSSLFYLPSLPKSQKCDVCDVQAAVVMSSLSLSTVSNSPITSPVRVVGTVLEYY